MMRDKFGFSDDEDEEIESLKKPKGVMYSS